MGKQHSGFSGWRHLVLTVVPLFALALGSVTVLGTETASAAPSLGVGCSSSSNGGVTIATLRLNVRDAVGLTLIVDGTTTDSSTPITTNPQFVTVGPLTASETILIGLWDGSGFVRTAEARIVLTSGVSCSVRMPASTPPSPPPPPLSLQQQWVQTCEDGGGFFDTSVDGKQWQCRGTFPRLLSQETFDALAPICQAAGGTPLPTEPPYESIVCNVF